MLRDVSLKLSQTFIILLLSIPAFATQTPKEECYIQEMLCFPIPEKRTDYQKNELLLLLKSKVPEAVYQSILSRYGLVEVSANKIDSLGLDLRVADTKGKDPLELSKAINRAYEDLEAATNNIYQVEGIVVEGLGNNHPKLITGANKAQQFSKGEGVLIGMIDGPVDTNSRSFGGRVEQEALVEINNRSVANLLHGSGVAGVMVSNNKQIGIAPGARLFSVAAFKQNNKGHFSSNSALITQAIDMVISKKVDILNLSFSGGYDPLVERMIKKAISSGIIVVASCGNDATNLPRYPAAIESVIAVTAVDHMKKPYKKANKGRYIDLAAPGVGVLTTAPGNRYQLTSGTSLAAANVSGSLALLLAKKKNVGSALLSYTAIDLGEPGRDVFFGDGLINVYDALKTLLD